MSTLRRKLQYGSGQCGYCYSHGHGADNCSLLKQRVEAGNIYAKKFLNSINGGGRVCGYCAEKGHSTATCSSRFNDFKTGLLNQKTKADSAFVWLHEIGFGPGAMLSGMSRESSWRSKDKAERIVIINDFKQHIANDFFTELLFGDQRNWYRVNAVDTTNEDVRSIYLPFHPVYAPRPTSVKVQVIHKSNEEDIEKLKSFLQCYTNPVMRYNTAEEFFSAGYKFKTGNTKLPEIDYTIRNANKNKTAC